MNSSSAELLWRRRPAAAGAAAPERLRMDRSSDISASPGACKTIPGPDCARSSDRDHRLAGGMSLSKTRLPGEWAGPPRAPRGLPRATVGSAHRGAATPRREGNGGRGTQRGDPSDEPDAISPAVQDRRPGGAARDSRSGRRTGVPERGRRDRGGGAGRVPHQPRLRPRGAGADPRRGARPVPLALARRQLPRGDRPGRVSGARPAPGGGGGDRRLLGGRRPDQRTRVGG